MIQIHRDIKEYVHIPEHIHRYRKSNLDNEKEMFLDWLYSLPVISYNVVTGDILENMIRDNVPNPDMFKTFDTMDLHIILFDDIM